MQPNVADITGRVTVRDMRRAAFARDSSALTEQYLQQYYICTEEEMQDRWGNRRDLMPVVKNGLRALGRQKDFRFPDFDISRPLNAIDTEWKGHRPLFEFARAFMYYGTWVDKVKQEKVPKWQYWLHEPLHKDIISATIEEHVTGAPDPEKIGLAVFICRNGLKTYFFIATAAWLLTRHRMLWDDYTTVRIIHDSEKAAKWRGEQVKQIFQWCRPFRNVYPDCRIPQERKYGSAENWDLPGRREADKKTIDAQMACVGMRSIKQGSHPDYDLMDDLESERHMRSPASREETDVFFDGLKYAAQLGTVRRVLAGTFYSPHGIHAYIMESTATEDGYGNTIKPLWDAVLLPAILNEGLDNETLLYPTRLTKRVLTALREDDLRKHGTDIFYQMQMMLRFKAQGATAFKAAMRYVDLRQPQTDEDRAFEGAVRRGVTAIFGDYANKDGSTVGTGDYTAIVAVNICYLEGASPKRVLLDAVYSDQLDINEGARRTLDLAKRYQADYIIPEEPGAPHNGPIISAQAAERGLPYILSYDRPGSKKVTGNIIPLRPRKEAVDTTGLATKYSTWKWAMFRSFIGDYNAGNWRIVKGLQETPFLLEEMEGFPNAKRVDFINALALGYVEEVRSLLPQPRVRQPKELRSRPYVLVPGIPNTGLVERRYSG